MILGGHEHEVFEECSGDSLILKVGQDAVNLGVIDVWWTESGEARHVILDWHVSDAFTYCVASVVRSSAGIAWCQLQPSTPKRRQQPGRRSAKTSWSKPWRPAFRWRRNAELLTAECANKALLLATRRADQAAITDLPCEMSSLNVRYEPSNLASFLLQKFKRGPLPRIFTRSGMVARIQRLGRARDCARLRLTSARGRGCGHEWWGDAWQAVLQARQLHFGGPVQRVGLRRSILA